MTTAAKETVASAPDRTILVALAGSHAHGLATPESDQDFTGVFVIPLRRYLDPSGHGAESIERVAGKGAPADAIFHDIGKFARLALKGNPTALQTLWAPVVYQDDLGRELRRIRKAFLHKGTLKPFFGYYESQRRRLEQGKRLHTTSGQWNTKWAAHMCRLMLQACGLSLCADLIVDLRECPDYARIRDIRLGRVPRAEAMALASRLHSDARALEGVCGALPKEPDRKRIAELVYQIRTSIINPITQYP